MSSSSSIDFMPIAAGMRPLPSLSAASTAYAELIKGLKKEGFGVTTLSEREYLTLHDLVRDLRSLGSPDLIYNRSSDLRHGRMAFLFTENDEHGETRFVFAADAEQNRMLRDPGNICVCFDQFAKPHPEISLRQTLIILLSSEEFQTLTQLLGDEDAQRTFLSELTDDADIEANLQSILNIAKQNGASDIHIEPSRSLASHRSKSGPADDDHARSGGWTVRYRVHGALTPLEERLDNETGLALINKLKVKANVSSRIKRSEPFGGNITFTDHEVAKNRNLAHMSLRMSGIPVQPNATDNLYHDVVLRVKDSDPNREFSIEKLGIDRTVLSTLLNTVKTLDGMILVCGPTGSGKTTTLYGLLEYIRSPKHKMVTIEDPIEAEFEGITQAQVNYDAGADFPTLLRSYLRHDPDVILIGEVRDTETANTAVEASLTGHMVFATVHAKDSHAAYNRMFQMATVNRVDFATAARGVLAQRLCPVCCPDCSRLVNVRDEWNEILGFNGSDAIEFDIPFRQIGSEDARRRCSTCSRTGIVRRQILAEYWQISADDRIDMMNDERDLSKYRTRAYRNGMKPLWRSALDLSLRQQISLQDMLQVASHESLFENRGDVRRILKKVFGRQ